MKKILFASLFLFSTSSMAWLQVSPSYVNFGRVAINSYRPSQTLWVRNYGQEPTDVYIRESFCGFEFDINDNCYWTLEPGESCNITVYYRPYREGYDSCRLDVSDDNYSTEYVDIRGQAYER